jgi:hypothetical protein
VRLFTQSAIGRVASLNAACSGDVTLRVRFSTGLSSASRLAAINANAATAMNPVQTNVRAVIPCSSLAARQL